MSQFLVWRASLASPPLPPRVSGWRSPSLYSLLISRARWKRVAVNSLGWRVTLQSSLARYANEVIQGSASKTPRTVCLRVFRDQRKFWFQYRNFWVGFSVFILPFNFKRNLFRTLQIAMNNDIDDKFKSLYLRITRKEHKIRGYFCHSRFAVNVIRNGKPVKSLNLYWWNTDKPANKKLGSSSDIRRFMFSRLWVVYIAFTSRMYGTKKNVCICQC